MELKLKNEWLSNLSETSIRTYLFSINDFFLFARKPYSEITEDDIVRYMERIREKFAIRTCNVRLSVVKSLFTFLLKNRHIEIDPARFVKSLPDPGVDMERVITESQYSKLLNEARHDRDRFILEFLWETGCRSSEMIHVCWLDFGRFDLPVKGFHGWVYLPECKGGKSRHVLIRREFYERAMRFKGDKKETDHIFRSRKGFSKGKPLEAPALRSIVRSIFRRANVKGSSHFIRHGFATRNYRQKEDIFLLKNQLGHSRLSETEDYIHAEGNSRMIHAGNNVNAA